MIESRFGYDKGYSKNSKASNFDMTDASNIASIAIMKLFPKDGWPMHEYCYCVDCAGARHEQEKRFDIIKQEIEKAMVVAFEEGKKWCET